MFPVLLPILAAGSAYSLSISISSINKVRTYEEATEKAAKYSNIAAEQLHNTRTTEAAGAVAVGVSLIAALALTVSWSARSPVLHLGCATANVAGLVFAADHISRFWRGKAKVPVPGAGNYNDSISHMDELARACWLLALGWACEVGLCIWELVV